MISDEKVERALQLIEKGGGNYEYFFANLNSPAWIRPLADRGRFRHPPTAEHIDNLVRYRRWPEGEYLLRMASVAPADVAGAVEPVCFASDNPFVHQILVQIASALPAEHAKNLVEQEIVWIRSRQDLFTNYPEKVSQLVKALIEDSEAALALELTKALIEVQAPSKTSLVSSDDGTSTFEISPVPVAKMDAVWYSLAFRHILDPLLRAAPYDLLKVLADNVDLAVSIHSSKHKGDDPDDYSWIWRRDLAHGSHYEILDECVSALAGAITTLGAEETDQSAQVINVLSEYRWPIFERLKSFALLQARNTDPETLAKFVTDPARFQRTSANPEFADVLQKYAASLTRETLEEVLSIIDVGPDPAMYAYYLQHRVRPEDVESERKAIIDRWRLDWLYPLSAVLTGEKKQQLDALVQKYDVPRVRSEGPRVVQGVERSSIDLAMMNTMSVDALVEYLRSWIPPMGGLPFEQPSHTGVANVLKAWVEEDPQRASAVVDRFLLRELHPAYLAALFDGFAAALKTEHPFNAEAVARAIEWACGTYENNPAEGRDGLLEANWNWVHMSAARLMSELFVTEQRLDAAQAPQLFRAVRALCNVPRPTEADEVEYKKSSKTHLSLALNSPRPVGVEALIRYGRWLKLSTPESDVQAKLEPVLRLLDEKLDPKQDSSVAVREAFGMNFRLLAWLDSGWLIAAVPRLFPGKSQRFLDRFAWDAYLQYGGGPLLKTLPALRGRYSQAIDALQRNRQDEVADTERDLATHLMQYYAHGAIELDDDLLSRFFEKASLALRAQAIGDIGWGLRQDNDPLDPQIRTRLMELWEFRLANLKTRPKQEAAELSTFGWWLASRKFPESWAVDQAMKVVELIRTIKPDFAVVETLASVVPRFPFEAVRIVRILLEEDRDGWAIHGWSQHLRPILLEALRKGEKANREAQDLVDLLVSKGFREYRDLGPRRTQES